MRGDVERSRRSYERGGLDESSASPDPLVQFRGWLDEALARLEIVEPSAMVLASLGADGQPSQRVVLLRGFDERGFVFFTNYESRKGRELAAHASASLLFWWGALERQVRIEGRVERAAGAESDAYFARRPRGHQIGAWASPQSASLRSRSELEARVQEAEARFAGEVPRPPFWGGMRVVPASYEFWQGRSNRIHDRLAYRRDGDRWQIVRLAP
ncbi:MAG: pyridoxamine 5'-phosphate oxidase [Vulcanimicrobiaceae bacterium]